MNEKLVQCYVEALQRGYLVVTEKEVKWARSSDHLHYNQMFSIILVLEMTVAGGSVSTRKLPEFETAFAIYNTPLMRALE